MARSSKRQDQWFKSSRSDQQNACVEVNLGPTKGVGVRDSKDEAGPALSFPDGSWEGFIAATKGGKFNLPA